jgi:Protein of unknown function (DUF5672)
MLKIPNTTLIAVSSVKIEATIFALQASTAGIEFESVKLVTHDKPKDLPGSITYEQCPKINNLDEYSKFVIYDLTKHVETAHCLLIQHDGFVLRPEKWENEFLNWDYIGAPWKVSPDSYIDRHGEHIRVGNGGFSLRSKNLLEIPSKFSMPFLEERGFYNEDGNICVYNRDFLLSHGIKYAPVEVASRFSKESYIPEYANMETFGFHGMGNYRL